MYKKRFRTAAVIMIAAVCAAAAVQGCSKSSSQKIRVGVAANFIRPFNEMAAAFEAQTGIKVEAAFTSSGNLYSQITSGAPYDMFLSADEERPAKLFKEGLADAPFVYANGQVILWSLKKENCSAKTWRDAVKLPGVKKIAIANPETAPYGMAAIKAIRAAGLESFLKPRLVNAQDIAQAFQYASTGAADAGFCALSSAYSDEGKKGYYLAVDDAPVVVQSACVLKRAVNRKDVDSFAAFIMSEQAVKIKNKYGYK